MSEDNRLNNTDSDELIISLQKEARTSIYKLDASGRIEIQYDAYIGADLGTPCLKTEYKYEDGSTGSSRKVIATRESVVAWPGYEEVSVGAGNDFDLIP